MTVHAQSEQDEAVAHQMLDLPAMQAEERSYYSAPGERGQRRRQAAQVYPLLAGLLARKPTVKFAIDLGRPLNPALQAAFGTHPDGRPRLAKGVLKRLQGVRWSTPEGIDLELALDALGDLPPDWFPKDEAEWHAYGLVAQTVAYRMAPLLQTDLAHLAAGSRGRWTEFLGRCLAAFRDTRDPEPGAPPPVDLDSPHDEILAFLDGACIATEDMVMAYADHVVLPAAAHATNLTQVHLSEVHVQAARAAAAAILFEGKSAPAVLEVVRHWHTQAPAVLAACVGDTVTPTMLVTVAEDGWPPLIGTQYAPNGLLLYPLTDPRALEAEGRSGADENGAPGLSHCVGNYAPRARAGSSFLISIREMFQNGGYRRLSTLELTPSGDGRFSVRQNKGYSNNSPCAAAREAAQWLVKGIEEGTVAVNTAGLREYRVALRRNKDEVRAVCGYPWRDADNVARAVEAFAEWAPRRWRGLPLEDLLASPELRHVTEGLDPCGYASSPAPAP